MVEKENLEAIRKKIASNLNRFDKVISDKVFIKHFGSLQGEKNQRIAPELKDLAAKQPLIANKQFYYQAKLEPTQILSDKLPDLLMDHYKAGKNVNDFLKEAW